MAFELTPIQHPNHWVLQFTGRLDTQASMALEQSFQQLLTQLPAQLVLDFSALDYIASAGLRMVLLALKQSKKQNTETVMCGLQASVAHVLQVSGFLNLVVVYDTCDAAIQALKPQA